MALEPVESTAGVRVTFQCKHGHEWIGDYRSSEEFYSTTDKRGQCRICQGRWTGAQIKGLTATR
jgi:hypothetical protein